MFEEINWNNLKRTEGDTMQITVNGETNELKDIEVNLSRLLEIREVESPEMVAVQLNGEFVEMQSYSSTYLKTGDDVEFLYFMGGGSR
jgi:sulfur carrier protein